MMELRASVSRKRPLQEDVPPPAVVENSRINDEFDRHEESLVVANMMNMFARGSGLPPLLELIPGECCPLGPLNFICLGSACKFNSNGKFSS